MQKSIFLDLEGTVIDSWEDPILLNSSRVAEWLEAEKATHHGVFSFAIYNAEELSLFHKDIALPLLRRLNIQLTLEVPTVATLTKTCTDSAQSSELFEMGKALAFMRYVKATFHTGEFILLDDKVETTTLYEDSNLRVKTVYVQSI